MSERSSDIDPISARAKAAIISASRSHPELRALTGPPVRMRGGGSSNQVYRVDTQVGSFALRVPPPQAEPFVDRRVEAEAVALASRLGIGPELVRAEDDGVLLTGWVDAPPLSAERLRSDPQAIQRVAGSLQVLHGSGCQLSRRFEIFAMVDSYRRELHPSGQGDDHWSPRLRDVLETARQNLARSPAPLVPSHCDLIPANCLDDGSRTLLIDWEYAGMNDPAWDLAYMALEGELDGEQRDVLLQSYAGGWVSPGRLQVFMLLCASLNHAWALSRSDAETILRPARAERQLGTAEAIACDPQVDLWLAAL